MEVISLLGGGSRTPCLPEPQEQRLLARLIPPRPRRAMDIVVTRENERASIEPACVATPGKDTETEVQGFRYTAVIRTLNSFPLVQTVVDGLRNQSFPPEKIVVVDSGSSPEDCTRLKSMADVFVPYPDEPFNFSKAINIGVERVETPYLLIISSHYVLGESTIVERALQACIEAGARAFFIGNACFSHSPRKEIRTQQNFDGGNGFSNACGFAPTDEVRRRPFREEVFSCEDQEWAAWYLRERGKIIVKINDPGIRYLNPRMNLTKLLNEHLALAYFVDRRRLSVANISVWALRAVFSLVKADLARARFKASLARQLWSARTRAPQKQSRYF